MPTHKNFNKSIPLPSKKKKKILELHMKDSSVLSSGTAYCYLLGKKDKPISLVARVTLPNPVHVYGAQSLSLLLGSVQTLNFTS